MILQRREKDPACLVASLSLSLPTMASVRYIHVRVWFLSDPEHVAYRPLNTPARQPANRHRQNERKVKKIFLSRSRVSPSTDDDSSGGSENLKMPVMENYILLSTPRNKGLPLATTLGEADAHQDGLSERQAARQ